MAGHGWGGKTRKMKIQGRVVALENSKRVWRAPTWGAGAKKTQKHNEKTNFHEIEFPMTVFSRHAANKYLLVKIVWTPNSKVYMYKESIDLRRTSFLENWKMLYLL